MSMKLGDVRFDNCYAYEISLCKINLKISIIMFYIKLAHHEYFNQKYLAQWNFQFNSKAFLKTHSNLSSFINNLNISLLMPFHQIVKEKKETTKKVWNEKCGRKVKDAKRMNKLLQQIHRNADKKTTSTTLCFH